jgi:hypothetical protein
MRTITGASRRALTIVLALASASPSSRSSRAPHRSLAVLADAGHMLSDTFSIALALGADAGGAPRRPAAASGSSVRRSLRRSSRVDARPRQRVDRGSPLIRDPPRSRRLDARRRGRGPRRQRPLGGDPLAQRARASMQAAAARSGRPARVGRCSLGGRDPRNRLDRRRSDRLDRDRARRGERLGCAARLDRDPHGGDAHGDRRGRRGTGDRVGPGSRASTTCTSGASSGFDALGRTCWSAVARLPLDFAARSSARSSRASHHAHDPAVDHDA